MSPRRSRPRSKQDGYLLAGLMTAIAIMMILSTVVFQAWEDALQREREAELIFRGEEIARGILRFRAAQGRGPNTLKELMEPGPNGEYYMRREYEDPMAEDGKWGLLYEAPGGGIVDPSNPASAQGLLQGADGQVGAGNPLGEAGSIGNNTDSRLNDAFGNQQQGGQGQQPGLGGPGSLGGVGNGTGTGSILNPNGEGGVGLPIAGVKTLSTETAFRIWQDRTDYPEWLFTWQAIEQARQQATLPNAASKAKLRGKFGGGNRNGFGGGRRGQGNRNRGGQGGNRN